jgi:hypothetical protein
VGRALPAEQARILRLLIERIDVAPDGISVTLHAAGIRSLVAELADQGVARLGRVRSRTGGRGIMTGRAGPEVDTLTIRIPIRLQRRGGRKLIMMPEGAAMPTPKPRRDETLIKALVRAHRWRRRIESGPAKSITDLAEQEGVTDAYVCRLLPGAVRGRAHNLPAVAARDLRRPRLGLGDHSTLLSRWRPRGRHIVVGWRADTPALTEGRGNRVRVKHQELS